MDERLLAAVTTGHGEAGAQDHARRHLTESAESLLASYLHRLRRSLSGTSVEVDEIEADVRDHIAAALLDEAEPVKSVRLQAILRDLGSPDQWVPDEDRAGWRRVIDQLQSGPEDWRLAYLCFGLSVVGLLTLPIGGPLLWIPAYFLGRAALSVMEERDHPVGPRRWLIYPVVVFWSFFFVSMILIVPVFAVVMYGIESGLFDGLAQGSWSQLPRPEYQLTIISTVLVALGSCWLLVALLSRLAIRPVSWALFPLLQRYEKRHALSFAILAASLAMIGLSYLALS